VARAWAEDYWRQSEDAKLPYNDQAKARLNDWNEFLAMSQVSIHSALNTGMISVWISSGIRDAAARKPEILVDMGDGSRLRFVTSSTGAYSSLRLSKPGLESSIVP
jgi:hypothetical protein